MAGTRTFLALPLPDAVREALSTLRASLPAPPRGLRWVDLAQAHATLVFLGDLDEAALAQVRARARAVAAATDPFDADLAGLGAFASVARARVIWVGWGQGASRVVALHAALVRSLARPPEARPFAAHVTLARARAPLDARDWWVAAPASWRSPRWRVDALEVVASERRADGARHTALERCRFAAP